MTVPWTRDRVLAVGPDGGSVAAGEKLALPGPRSGQGWDDQALWGLCQGSGKRPYQTVVELATPAFKCSCPSRKFPCKHAVALMLLWADGGVGRAEQQPGFVREWLDSRAQRT